MQLNSTQLPVIINPGYLTQLYAKHKDVYTYEMLVSEYYEDHVLEVLAIDGDYCVLDKGLMGGKFHYAVVFCGSNEFNTFEDWDQYTTKEAALAELSKITK